MDLSVVISFSIAGRFDFGMRGGDRQSACLPSADEIQICVSRDFVCGRRIKKQEICLCEIL